MADDIIKPKYASFKKIFNIIKKTNKNIIVKKNFKISLLLNNILIILIKKTKKKSM